MIITIIDDYSYGVLERENELNEIKTGGLINTVWKQKRLMSVNVHTICIHFLHRIKNPFYYFLRQYTIYIHQMCFIFRAQSSFCNTRHTIHTQVVTCVTLLSVYNIVCALLLCCVLFSKSAAWELGYDFRWLNVTNNSKERQVMLFSNIIKPQSYLEQSWMGFLDNKSLRLQLLKLCQVIFIFIVITLFLSGNSVDKAFRWCTSGAQFRAHSGCYEDGCVLGHCAVFFGRRLPNLRRCLLPPQSGRCGAGSKYL